MLANRPEFHLADLAVVTLGATPFSIYQTYSPEQIEYVDRRRRRAGRHHRAGVPRRRPGGARAPADQVEHVIVVDGEARRTGTMALADVEGAEPRASTSRPRAARSAPTTC